MRHIVNMHLGLKPEKETFLSSCDYGVNDTDLQTLPRQLIHGGSAKYLCKLSAGIQFRSYRPDTQTKV